MSNSVNSVLGNIRKSIPYTRMAYSIMIALMPLLSNFKGVMGLGLGTCLLGIAVPYALIFVRSEESNKTFIPLYVMYAYFMLRSWNAYTSLLLYASTLISLIAISKGAMSIKHVRKTVETVAVVATFLIVIQYIGYYLFDVKIVYLVKALLRDEFRAQLETVQGSLYRPSAFFLEPSHYTQYCIVGLISSLFPVKGKPLCLPKIACITVGCILTTSGMGIVLLVAAFGWFALFYRNRENKRPIPILLWLAAVVFAFAVLMMIPFFRMTILRVIGNVDGYNAVDGRLGSWAYAISPMTGWDVLFGYGAKTDFSFYLTGIMEIIFHYGWLGFGCMCYALLAIVIRGKKTLVTFIVLAYFGLMIIADMSDVYNMVYYLGIAILLCRKPVVNFSLEDSLSRLLGVRLEEYRTWKQVFAAFAGKMARYVKNFFKRQWWIDQFICIAEGTKEPWTTFSKYGWWKYISLCIDLLGRTLFNGQWWKQMLRNEIEEVKSFTNEIAARLVKKVKNK